MKAVAYTMLLCTADKAYLAMAKHYPSPLQRAALLSDRRNRKMAKSAHAYVRGNTAQFYAWLEQADATLPQGPAIWICGDCHVSNIGPVAGADGEVDIQVRDLDQTVLGNPAHDIIRLGVSLAMAARGSALPGVVTAAMIEQLVAGYVAALETPVGEQARRSNVQKRPRAVRYVMRRAMKRKWRHLAAERIEGVAPNIPLSRKYWPISAKERNELKRLMASEDIRRLVTSLSQRDASDPVEMLDAAYWVKGCSSLGLLRFAVLLRVGKSDDPASSLCLLDVKEAIKTVAPRAPNVHMPKDHAERVIKGAKKLSPHLGERMLAAKILDKSVFIRELLPQDLKLEIETLEQSEATAVASYLGNVVGRSHGAQMTEQQRRQWSTQLAKSRSASLDAPSWLWRSVVELVQAHEGAYLDHCRRYANVEA